MISGQGSKLHEESALAAGQRRRSKKGVVYMAHTRYVPAPPLNAYIDNLYYLDGPAPYRRQKVLPHPSFNLMVNLGQTFQVYDSVQAQPLVTCSESWWVGLWSKYHIVDWPPNVQVYGVHF